VPSALRRSIYFTLSSSVPDDDHEDEEEKLLHFISQQ
jgi:hypothetical protein